MNKRLHILTPQHHQTGPMMNRFLAAASLFFFSINVHAFMAPSAPTLNNSAYVLMDFDSGKILAESNPDLQVEPASLTKMMTSYIVERALESGRLKEDEQVHVSEHAWCRGTSAESCMYLPLHGSASVMEMLRGIVIQSGNDASKAIAEHMAGTEQAFAEIMNAEAKRLGMKNSNFVNSTGMPAPGHVSTARDMAILARAIIQDSPHYYPIYAERSFTYNNIRQGNRNALLYTDPSVDGLKTGHTNAAGYCLVTSAKRGNMRLISAIMGTTSMQERADQTRALLNWGFSNFETVTPLTSGQVLAQAPLWYGRESMVNAGLAEDFSITMPRGKKDEVEPITRINSDLKAPIAKGDVVGEVQIKLNNEVIATQALVAMSDVDRANFIVRLWHGIKRFFSNLF